MKNIADIDTNFKIESKIEKDDIRFYNVKSEPFKIYGIYWEDGMFRRLPEMIAKSVSDGVHFLSTNTAGGRVRFKTDSPYIAINAKMNNIGKMPHFALTGSAGFDIYVKENGVEQYYKTFMPPFDVDIIDGYESIIYFDTQKMRDITINFPTYSGVNELYIGLQENADILEPSPYKTQMPIVYYGSSITQGGCCSRPGNAYESIISQKLDCDYLNLGFSGSAKAEKEMIEYIKNLEMSVFVYDYDHNAPSTEHLQQTHETMFKEIRNSHPDLPIIIMSRPKYTLTEEEKERLEIIKTTYNNAVMSGDKNVYMLDGKTLMCKAQNSGTVDDCHPNDLGFASMADSVYDLLVKII